MFFRKSVTDRDGSLSKVPEFVRLLSGEVGSQKSIVNSYDKEESKPLDCESTLVISAKFCYNSLCLSQMFCNTTQAGSTMRLCSVASWVMI